VRLICCDIGYDLRAKDYLCVSIRAFVLVKLAYCDIGYDLRAMDYFEQSLVICEDNADLYGQVLLRMTRYADIFLFFLFFFVLLKQVN
jgi:hypothetical protein